MTIESIDSIDGAGLDKSSGEIVLLISDHLSWDDTDLHFRLLEKKIGSYLNFVRSGQVFEMFPSEKNRSVRISLIYKFEPTEIAIKFLSAAKMQLAAMDIGFSYTALPEHY